MRWLLRPSRLAILALGLVGLYALVGFFLVPYLIKAYAIPVVVEKLKRPVLIREVELNPFALSLRLTGFEIREADQSALLGSTSFSSIFRRVLSFVGLMSSIRFGLRCRMCPRGYSMTGG